MVDSTPVLANSARPRKSVVEGSIVILKLVANLSVPALLIALANGPLAGEKPDFSRVPLPAGLVAPEARSAVAAMVCFFEGPAVDETGNVFFSDIPGNRI